MITDKDKREIKDLIDETIEAQRKNRNAAYLWSFLVGCIGAGIFFIGTLILFGSHFSGIAGLATGFIYGFDIWLMYEYTKVPYKHAGETHEE